MNHSIFTEVEMHARKSRSLFRVAVLTWLLASGFTLPL